MIKDFKKFLEEYKVIPLAVAFILAVALTTLITAVVSYLIMPVITFFIPGGAWRNAAFAVGPIIIPWGALLSAIITFVVIAFVVFLMIRSYSKDEKGKK